LTRGRAVVLLGLLILGAAFVVRSIPERVELWSALGVLPYGYFSDSQIVTSAWECARQGYDVLFLNPCSPFGVPMNIPRIWLIPSVFGLGQGFTETLGVLMALAFGAGAALLAGPLGLIRGAAFLGVILLSPGVLFGVERGNVDMFIFALMAFAVTTQHARLGAGIATVLKLFPVFALLPILNRRVVLILGFYAVLTLRDLWIIRLAAQTPLLYSYGVVPNAHWLLPGLPGEVLILGAVALAAVLGGWHLRSAPDTYAFQAGAAIYLGTYVLGSNFDYRIVFLLLTLPTLLLARTVGSFVVLGLTVAVLLLTRYMEGPGLPFLAGQAAQLALALTYSAILGRVAVGRLRPVVIPRPVAPEAARG
jgi:hypothetical protein